SLNKVEPIRPRADRLRRHHEADPRATVPVFLALRGARRPAGPSLPVPRRPPLGGRATEARGGPRCLPGTPDRGAPAPARRDLGPRPPAVDGKGLRPRGPSERPMQIRLRLFAPYPAIVGARRRAWAAVHGNPSRH